jgi:peptide/nickel transport system permease protein
MKGATGWKLLGKKFVRDRSALSGLIILIGLIFTAALAPYLAPFPEDVSATHPAQRLRPPSWEHPLGTDTLGRDIYSRILYGGRNTLVISVTVVTACIVIGVPAGLIAGYCENFVGNMIMRIADIFLAVPRVILALALSQALGPSLPNMLLALTITYWPWFARTVAAETRSVKQATFIEASDALGMRPMRVVFWHVLPNVLSSIIVRSTIGMGFTILTAAALGFLGVGAQPPAPEWGAMIAEARLYLPDAWWYATSPGLAIFLVVMGFNLLGDGLRDILDPRLRRTRG